MEESLRYTPCTNITQEFRIIHNQQLIGYNTNWTENIKLPFPVDTPLVIFSRGMEIDTEEK